MDGPLLPLPPPPACLDLDADDRCADYAADGQCADNPGYMSHRCAAMCNACVDGHGVKEDPVVAAFVAPADAGGGAGCGDDNYQCLA